MKKFLYTLAILSVVIFSFTNIYATNMTNSTPNIAPYNDTAPTMDNTFDSLSVGIIVASILIVIGVVFFYLIPKE